MAKTIDERIVSMAFENAKFEANIAKTMATLKKFNDQLSKVGAVNGLDKVEASTHKINFNPLSGAVDKLKGKFDFSKSASSLNGVQTASEKINLSGASRAAEAMKGSFDKAVSGATSAIGVLKRNISFEGSTNPFSAINNLGSKLNFDGASRAIEAFKGRFSFGGTAAKAFSNIETESSKVHFTALQSSMMQVTKGFSVIQGAASVAFGNIAAQAATHGAAKFKEFALGPIQAGLEEYGTNMNSIQTILANTEDKGSTLKDVNGALAELNTYSDKTIYNFTEMAKNIGTFTAAGVDLKTSTQSIKGIANLAALSGSNSQQASTAMYQLSQAISSGKVGLQDWNSVVNAGMGGAVFQKNLVRTAVAMGTLNKNAVKIDKATGKLTINGQSFREAITAKPGQKSFLTGEVLTSSLKTFTGDLTDAQLKAQGFGEAEIKSIQATAKTAQKAATEVKTIGQVFDVAKETLGSGWTSTFQTIFGDFGKGKALFTGMSNALNGFINANSKARNDLLKGWAKLGGRDVLIKGLKSAFKDLQAVLKPLKDGFRAIFPAQSAKSLLDMTKRFKELMDSLRPSKETQDRLKTTFEGLFAVMHIGLTVIKGVGHLFKDLFDKLGGGQGNFLDFTANLGKFFISLDNAISKGDAFNKWIDRMVGHLNHPIELLKHLGRMIASLFGGPQAGDSEAFVKVVDSLHKAIKPLGSAFDSVQRAMKRFEGWMHQIGQAAKPMIGSIRGGLDEVGDAFKEAFSQKNLSAAFEVLQTGLIGGLLISIKKVFGGGVNINVGGKGGIIGQLSQSLGTLQNSLVTMQRNVQAKTLATIAAAVLLLATGVTLLATIDSKKLATSMTAVAVGLGEMIAALSLLKPGGDGWRGMLVGLAELPVLAGTVLILAGAMVIMAAAVKIFATMNLDEVATGLFGVGGSLLALGLGVAYIPKDIALTVLPLLGLGVAINLLAIAVKIFATMNLDQVGTGLFGIGGALIAVGRGSKFIGPGALSAGPALIPLAAGLVILAVAVAMFGNLKITTLVKGILAIGEALTVIGFAMSAMPKNLVVTAFGLNLVATALFGLSIVIGILGNMKIATLAKGLLTMAFTFDILAFGLKAMEGTGAGTLALMGAAVAFAVLGPALAFMGNLKIITIVKGLVAMAAVIAVLGLVGGAVAPGLEAVGIAFLALGGAALLAGAGLYLVGKGLSLISKDSGRGIAALVAAIVALIAVIPKVLVNFIKGIVDTFATVVALAPKIAENVGKLIGIFVDMIISLAPKVGVAFDALILTLYTSIVNSGPKLVEGGFKIVEMVLQGLVAHMPSLIEKAGTIVVEFLTGLNTQMPKVILAGATLIITFMNGVAQSIGRIVLAGANIIVKFLEGLATNAPRVIYAAQTLILNFVTAMYGMLPRAIGAGASLIGKILEGIGNAATRVTRTAVRVVGNFLAAAAQAMLDLTNRIAKIVTNFLNGLAQSIRDNGPAMRHAGWNVADAILDGMVDGFKELANKPIDAIKGVIGHLPKAARKLLDINSPSRVFMSIGASTMEGLTKGVDGTEPVRAISSTVSDMLGAADSLKAVPNALDGLVDVDPTITPVLDLTHVEAGAKKIGDLTNVTPITAAASFGQAGAISSEKEAVDTQAQAAEQAAQPPSVLNFNQTNTSPEALPPVEIYRRTNNALSQAKSMLENQQRPAA